MKRTILTALIAATLLTGVAGARERDVRERGAGNGECGGCGQSAGAFDEFTARGKIVRGFVHNWYLRDEDEPLSIQEICVVTAMTLCSFRQETLLILPLL